MSDVCVSTLDFLHNPPIQHISPNQSYPHPLPSFQPSTTNPQPKGLDYPSIIGSKYLLPSYFLPLPRTPNHRSELLILSALIIAARSNKPDDRREYQYWTLNVASGLWSPEQFSAAEKVMSRNLRVNMVRDEELEFFAGEMERMAGKMGVLGG